jgi:hypothetical protein
MCTLRRYHPKKVGSAAVILVAIVVMMAAIETMRAGGHDDDNGDCAWDTDTSPIPPRPKLAIRTLLLALSIPAPPTIHKHPLFGLIFPAEGLAAIYDIIKMSASIKIGKAMI